MASINVNAMVEYALSFQGIPYVYGGNGTAAQCYKWTQGSSCSVHKKGVKYTGYDCSGFRIPNHILLSLTLLLKFSLLLLQWKQ